MNNNPQMSNMLNILKNGNPQQIVINMLQQNMNGNPLLQNVMNMANMGNSKGIEGIARNLAKSKGIDYDKEFNAFKSMLGMK